MKTSQGGVLVGRLVGYSVFSVEVLGQDPRAGAHRLLMDAQLCGLWRLCALLTPQKIIFSLKALP